MRMNDKRIIVTGAASGIGAATAQLLAAEGASVVLVDRNHDAVQTVASDLRERGENATAFAADLQYANNVDDLFAQIVAQSNAVDGLVNCAGVGTSWAEKSPGSMNDIATTPVDKYHEIMRINLDSTVFMCRLAIPLMKENGAGAIVNFSSVYGVNAPPTHHTYAMTKAAISHLTRSMAVAYASDGVRVNAIVPGFIDTPMNACVGDIFSDPRIAHNLMPMRRAGTPTEVALACLYLLSSDSSYVTGVILPVDGGQCAK